MDKLDRLLADAENEMLGPEHGPQVVALARQSAEQAARVVELEAALRFYGGHDPDNSDHGDWVERMNEDGGDVARAALGAS